MGPEAVVSDQDTVTCLLGHGENTPPAQLGRGLSGTASAGVGRYLRKCGRWDYKHLHKAAHRPG